MAALQRQRLSHTVVLVCCRFLSTTVAYSFVIALVDSLQFDVLTEKHSLYSNAKDVAGDILKDIINKLL